MPPNLFQRNSYGSTIGNSLVLAGLSGLAPVNGVSLLVTALENTVGKAVDLNQAKCALRFVLAIGDGLGSFGWIKVAAGIALEIINIVDIAQSNETACRAVALRVYRLICVLGSRAQDCDGKRGLEHRIKKFEADLENVLKTVKEVSAYGSARQVLKAETIQTKLKECNTLLDEYISEFQVNLLIHQEHMLARLEVNVEKAVVILEQQKQDTSASSTNLLISKTLPLLPAIFVGRDELVLEGITYMASNPAARIVILGHGGGIGKTSLSLALVHHETTKAQFKDKRYFVSCEAFKNSLDLVLAILQILGRSVVIKEEDILTTFHQQLLSTGKMLLVLDNFETLWIESNSMTELQRILDLMVSIDSLTLIVNLRGDTSPLGAHECLILPVEGLGSLSEVAATEMYLRAQAKSRTFNQRSLDDLAKLLAEIDYVPLAISLVSALGNNYTPSQLLHRWTNIKNKTDLLQIPGVEKTKLTSVSLSISLSLQSSALSGSTEAFRLLAILALLPEGLAQWSEPLQIITSDFADVHYTADILCKTSLIYKTRMDRLTMLSPTRHYINGDNERNINKYPDDFENVLAFINDSVQKQSDNLLQFGKLNVTRVLEKAVTFAPTATRIEEALACSIYLYGKNIYLTNLMEIVVAAVKKMPSAKELLADSTLHYAHLLEALNLWEKAEQQSMSACELYRRQQNERGIANALKCSGNNLRMLSRSEEAVEKHNASYQIFKKLDDWPSMADILNCLGDDLYKLEKFSEASEKHTAAYDIFKKLKLQSGIANSLQGLGNAAQTPGQHGKYIDAQENHQAAYLIFNELQDRSGTAHALLGLGDSLRALGKHPEASEKHQAAYDLFNDVQNQHGMATSLKCLGHDLWNSGKYHEAAERHQSACDIFMKLQDPKAVAYSLVGLASAFRMLARYSEAAEKEQEAFDVFNKLQLRLSMGYSMNALGDDLRLSGRYSEALEKHQVGYDIFTQLDDQHGMADCQESIGNDLRMMRRYTEALEKHMTANTIFTKHHIIGGVANSLNNMGYNLHSLGRYEEAAEKHEAAYDMFSGLNFQLGMANALNGLGHSLRALGKHDEASKKHTTAHDIYNTLQYKLGIADALDGLGSVLRMQEKFPEAAEKHLAAHDIYKELQDIRRMADTLNNLGYVLDKSGKYREASQKHNAAHDFFAKLQDQQGMIDSLKSVENSQKLQGEFDQTTVANPIISPEELIESV